MRSSALGAWLGIVLLAGAVPRGAGAAVDPDLIVLDAKVNGVTGGIDAFVVQIEVVAQQLDDEFVAREQGLLELEDARARNFEALLLECVLEPSKCTPPRFLTSVFDPLCEHATGGGGGGGGGGQHQHELGTECPLLELLAVVEADLTAAETQGLDRDYARARSHVEAAKLSIQAKDGLSAFWELCAAFGKLACP